MRRDRPHHRNARCVFIGPVNERAETERRRVRGTEGAGRPARPEGPVGRTPQGEAPAAWTDRKNPGRLYRQLTRSCLHPAWSITKGKTGSSITSYSDKTRRC